MSPAGQEATIEKIQVEDKEITLQIMYVFKNILILLQLKLLLIANDSPSRGREGDEAVAL